MSKSKFNLPRYNMSYFFLSFFLCVNTIIFSQTHWVAAREIDEAPFQIIKPNGTLAFILQPGEIPQITENRDPSGIMDNFNTFDFSGGVMIVVKDEKGYFIDQKGKKVSKIGENIRFSTPLINGFFMVHSNIGNSRVITYYDKRGNILFGGKIFWIATKFENGKAITQEYNANENFDKQSKDFHIIDTSGKSIFNISQFLMPVKILNLARYNSNFLSITTTDYKTIYFDIEKLKIENKIIRDYQNDSLMRANLKNLADAKGITLSENIETFISRTGISKDSISNGYLEIGKQHGYLVKLPNKSEGRKELFKVDGTSILELNEEFITEKDGYLVTKIKKDSIFPYRYKNIETMEYLGKTQVLPFYIQDGYFVFGSRPGALRAGVDWPPVKNGNGIDIWPKHRTPNLKVTSIDEIFKNPNQIISIKLNSINTEIQNIKFPILPEAFELHLEKSSISDISPLIDKCPKLSKLYITDCPNLSTVISSKIKSNINFIFLINCPLIENSMDKIISLFPNIKTVRGDYKNDLIKKYPNITFETVLSEVE